MGLLKTSLIAGGVLLGVGTAGGLGTVAVIAKQEKAQQENLKQDETDKNTAPISNASVYSILNSIGPSDISVISNNEEKPASDFYAFDLGNNTLDVSSVKAIPQGFSTRVSVRSNQNDVEKLNDGKLKVLVEVAKLGTNERLFKELEANTFKKADQKLLDLLDKDSFTQKPTNAYSLELMPKKDLENKLVTVSELNSDNGKGFDSLLKDGEKTSSESLSIEGKVKVSSISKNNSQETVFTLSAATQTGYLKLVKKTGEKIDGQALFKEIKTANLLADGISVTSMDKDRRVESDKFALTMLEKAKATASNGFKHEDDKLGLTVQKGDTSPTEASDVDLSVYVYRLMDNSGTIKVPVGLELTYGTGSEATTFTTTNKNDAKMLEEAGFSFHVYARLLEDDSSKAAHNIDAKHLNGTKHTLGNYLNPENYKKPSESKTQTPNGSLDTVSEEKFYVSNPVTKDFDKPIELVTKGWMTNKWRRNYIAFADYSFVAAGDSMKQVLKDKVLYGPKLTLIHVIDPNQIPKRNK